MITSFEVGAVFKIINEASPALLKMLDQVRELNKMISRTRENLALIAQPAAMGTAVSEADGLAAAWGKVAGNARAARTAISEAAAPVSTAVEKVRRFIIMISPHSLEGLSWGLRCPAQAPGMAPDTGMFDLVSSFAAFLVS